MVIHIRAEDLAGMLETLAERMRHRITAEEERSAQDAHAALVEQSSGTTTTKTLRRMGHPFARRDPQTPMDPSVINAQTGDYRDAWTQQPAEVTRSTVTVRVTNSDRAARFMGGTRRMVARPIIAAVKERLTADRHRRLRAAADEVLRGE